MQHATEVHHMNEQVQLNADLSAVEDKGEPPSFRYDVIVKLRVQIGQNVNEFAGGKQKERQLKHTLQLEDELVQNVLQRNQILVVYQLAV